MSDAATLDAQAEALKPGVAGLRKRYAELVAGLDPAQRAFFHDPARIIAVKWHRQKGKDYAAAAKTTFGAAFSGETWYLVSLTQRQADQTFEKCKLWGQRWHDAMGEAVAGVLDDEEWTALEGTARELRFPSGGKIVSLPGKNPDALAGFTGNILLTEMGLFPDGGFKHWDVVFPITTRGFKFIGISTPRGRATKFFDLCSNPDRYSVHECDIHRSVAEGYELRDENGDPTTIEAFKAAYGSEGGWRRDFLVEFSGDMEALVSWGRLVAAGERGAKAPFELLEITREAGGWRPGWFRERKPDEGRLELGYDVARHRDLAVLWVNHNAGGGTRSLRQLVLMRDVTFELQRAIVSDAMGSGVPAVGCGDATGLGMDSNETLRNRFGARWEPVTFTAGSKSEMGSLLATAFGDGVQDIPPADGATQFIAADLYAVQKEETGAGQTRRLRLTEADNPLLPESHCDIAYAGALALMAGRLSGFTPRIIRL